ASTSGQTGAPCVGSLGVDPLAGRNLNPDLSVAVWHKNRFQLLWDREVKPLVHLLHRSHKFFGPLDGALPTVPGRHNQMLQPDFKLERGADVVRNDEEDFVPSP